MHKTDRRETLSQDASKDSVHYDNLQPLFDLRERINQTSVLAVEMYKITYELSPEFMWDMVEEVYKICSKRP